jgi:hypothetical protein
MSGHYCKGRPGNTGSTGRPTRTTHRGGTSALTVAFVLGLSGIAGFSPSACAAEPDPYLSALNAEGGKLESLGKAKQEQEALMRLEASEKKQATPPQPAKTATAASSTSAKSFEDDLQKSFPGSYALYSLMDANEKQQVLAEYQQRKSEGAARYIPVIKKIIAITNAKRIRTQQ